jgi:dihydrofolate reductase
MIISLIVAAATNNVIGKNNKLLWHLPNDLKFFKNTTWGMPVIMGRKTYDSIAGEPLPGRFNIVITRNTEWNPGREDVWIVQTLEEAVEKAKQTDCKEVFVAGGGEIYYQSITIANRIYLTRVHAEIEGDILFPVINETEWEQTHNVDFAADDKHAYAYSFQTWERR